MKQLNRRDILLAAPLLAITASLHRSGNALSDEITSDEQFWSEVRRAFVRDPTIINLNNGGVAPAPTLVLDAQIDDIRYSNLVPSYRMWNDLEPKIEQVRKKIALLWKADPDCIAITRNASESLENVQLGINLQPGDEVLITSQDYPRMITTWQQRARREGIVLRQLDFAPPVQDPMHLVRLYESAITSRTRVIHVSHVIFMTGQIVPVKEICKLARSRGIVSIVDGAHAFAHVPFTFPEIDCDYYGSSLHKWLSAPIGTGVLYVRKDRIEKTWPLMAAPASMDNDIRKFEEIGTHPAAMHNAIGEALSFHEHLGACRKFARLSQLKRRWAERLSQHSWAKMLVSLDSEQSGAFATLHLDGFDPGRISATLLDKHHILVTPITGPGFDGLRISPNVYTSIDEIDNLCDALEILTRKT